MCFKKFFISLALLGSLIPGLVGCSNYLKGQKNKEEVMDLPNPDLERLKTLPEDMKKLSIGELSSSDIRKNFETIQFALKYFVERTRGSGNNAYSVEDMRGFFGKYFLK